MPSAAPVRRSHWLDDPRYDSPPSSDFGPTGGPTRRSKRDKSRGRRSEGIAIQIYRVLLYCEFVFQGVLGHSSYESCETFSWAVRGGE